MTHKTKVIIFDSGINVNELAKRILDNEPKILEKHPTFPAHTNVHFVKVHNSKTLESYIIIILTIR